MCLPPCTHVQVRVGACRRRRTHTHVHADTRAHKHTQTSTGTHACMYTGTHQYAHTYTHACSMHMGCTHGSEHAFRHPCAPPSVRARMRTDNHRHVCEHQHCERTRAHVRVNAAYADIYACTYTHMHDHTHTHAWHLRPCERASAHSLKRSHTQAHFSTHTHTRTRSHACGRALISEPAVLRTRWGTQTSESLRC